MGERERVVQEEGWAGRMWWVFRREGDEGLEDEERVEVWGS